MTHFLGTIILSGLVAISYSLADSPKQEPLTPGFTWDFTQKKKITYSYNVQDNSEMQTHQDSIPHLSKSTLTGNLTISSTGDNTATLAYENLSMKSYDLNQEREITDSSYIDNLDMSVPGLKPNSRVNNPSLDVLWSSIIPLPKNKIQVGEISQIKLQYPIRNFGS